MIGLPSGARVWLACGVTDLRNGFDGLAGLVQTRLTEDAILGSTERGRFVWPRATSGTVHLSAAQLSMLLEGIDWRRPQRTHTPQLAV
jgi:transposase